MNNQQMMELTTVEKSEFEQLVSECTRSGSIDSNLYIEYDVKRGLRDSNGNGVLTGLTEISDVCGCHSVNGRKIPVDGELYFQGYNVEDIIKGSSRDRFRCGIALFRILNHQCAVQLVMSVCLICINRKQRHVCNQL